MPSVSFLRIHFPRSPGRAAFRANTHQSASWHVSVDFNFQKCLEGARAKNVNPVRLGILLRRREQPAFGPLDAGRFNPVNRRRDSFHRVALATLEHAVLESSQAGVYTLQIHAFPTRWAARTIG